MIVLIDDDVFDHADSMTLIALFKAGDWGMHRIQVLPPWETEETRALNRWLARQGDARQMIELLLEFGLSEEAESYGCDIRIRVRLQPSEGRPDELDPETAYRLLNEPFEVLLENFENDWCFLKILARKWSQSLSLLESRRLLRPRHGGGDTLKAQIQAVNPLRSFVLFDSDATLARKEESPQPSTWSEGVKKDCVERDLAHHQLRRRAAENYLPLNALAAWTSIRSGRHKRKTYRTFCQMEPKLRHYYAMREGLEKDRPDVGAFGSFATKPELEKGFGTKVRDLFREEDFRLQEPWIERDLGEERNEIVMKLLRRL